MSENMCDIVIIGGGPVGASLALALRGSGLAVSVLEARQPESAAADPRALALAYGSRLLLERLGVWRDLPDVTTIKTIHISQRHAFGRAVLRAEALRVPGLGYVLPYHALHGALCRALEASGMRYLTGAAVTGLDSGADAARVTYRHEGVEQVLDARLAVVADGGKLLDHSHPPQVTDYGQSAVIAHITCSHPRADTAFERFTAQGPAALLPYMDGYELVWTAPHERAQEMVNWAEADFLEQLHAHFGDRVGRFTSVGPRTCYPLRLRRAPQITFDHTVLLGNAAQTLHPVAGQGFNMGLRDAWELAQEILRCAPDALGAEGMLAAYRHSRSLDRNAGMRFTDGLVRLFSNDLPGLRSGRAAMLSVLDAAPAAKEFVARRMMFGANG
jgi:2-octaprenyl-6-methoxyphenol hydroxylase